MAQIAAAKVVNGLALVPLAGGEGGVELVFVDANGNQQGGAAFCFFGSGNGDIYAAIRNNPGMAFNSEATGQIFITGQV